MDLPIEIMQAVVHFVDDLPTLRALAIASRIFRRQVQKIIFGDITVVRRGSIIMRIIPGWRINLASILPVLENTGIAGFVRILDLRCEGVSSNTVDSILSHWRDLRSLSTLKLQDITINTILFKYICEIASGQPIELLFQFCVWPEPSYSTSRRLLLPYLFFEQKPSWDDKYNDPHLTFLRACCESIRSLVVIGVFLPDAQRTLVVGLQSLLMPQITAVASSIRPAAAESVIVGAILDNFPSIRTLHVQHELTTTSYMLSFSAPLLSSVKAPLLELLNLIPGRPVENVEIGGFFSPLPVGGYGRLTRCLTKSTSALRRLDLYETEVMISCDEVVQIIDSHPIVEAAFCICPAVRAMQDGSAILAYQGV